MDPGGRRPGDRWLVKPHATLWDRDVPRRTAHSTRLWPGDCHAGAMMLPIPRAGFLQRVEGLDRALSIPGIEDIAITAKPAEKLRPFPEGASYPGFIFARGATPQDVGQALRAAYRQLRLVIAPGLDLL